MNICYQYLSKESLTIKKNSILFYLNLIIIKNLKEQRNEKKKKKKKKKTNICASSRVISIPKFASQNIIRLKLMEISKSVYYYTKKIT